MPIPPSLIEWVPAIGGLIAGAGLWALAMYTRAVSRRERKSRGE